MPDTQNSQLPKLDEQADVQTKLNVMREAAQQLARDLTIPESAPQVVQDIQRALDSAKLAAQNLQLVGDPSAELNEPAQLWTARDGLEKAQQALKNALDRPPDPAASDQVLDERVIARQSLEAMQQVSDLAGAVETDLHQTGDALKNAASALAKEIGDGVEMLQQNAKELLQRNEAEQPISVNDMGFSRLEQRMQELEQAINSYDEKLTSDLSHDQLRLLDDLRFAMVGDDMAKLMEVRQELDRSAYDHKALEQAASIAQAADNLLDEVQSTSVSWVSRQEIGNPNRTRRPNLGRLMGGRATDLEKGELGQRFEWMHMLGRVFGGGDSFKDLITGNKEVHKDFTTLENRLRDLRDEALVEVQITTAHQGVFNKDRVKERIGYEMRYEVWLDGDKVFDRTRNLQATERDPNLKVVFDELRNLKQDLKDGRSPEETVQRLVSYLDTRDEGPLRDLDRMTRLNAEQTGGASDSDR
ncbi:MAG: hypothetical protein H8K04_00270 [Nitrospira sp.]